MADSLLTDSQRTRMEVLDQLAATMASHPVHEILNAADWVLNSNPLSEETWDGIRLILRDAVNGDPEAREIVRKLAGINDDEIEIDLGPTDEQFRHDTDDTVTMPTIGGTSVQRSDG